jgi:hypothetical protein
MSKKYIAHVNKQIIQQNNKREDKHAPITIKSYNTNEYAHSVAILDKNGEVAGRIVHEPHNPLSCGAKVWIELDHGYKILEDDTKTK